MSKDRHENNYKIDIIDKTLNDNSNVEIKDDYTDN